MANNFAEKHIPIELASLICGVTEQTYRNWLKQDNPPPFLPKNKMVPAKALGEWIRNHQILKKGRGGGGYPYLNMIGVSSIVSGNSAAPTMPGVTVTPDVFEAPDQRLKRLQGDKVEIEIREKSGELIPVEDVRRGWESILGRMKMRLLRLPVAMSPLVAGETDHHAIQEKLSGAVHDALAELSAGWDDDDEPDRSDIQ